MTGLSGWRSLVHYIEVKRAPVLALTRVHLLMTLVALLAGAVLGVAAGILAYRQPRARQAIIGTAGLILTVPSRRQHRLGFRNGEYAWLAL